MRKNRALPGLDMEPCRDAARPEVACKRAFGSGFRRDAAAPTLLDGMTLARGQGGVRAARRSPFTPAASDLVVLGRAQSKEQARAPDLPVVSVFPIRPTLHHPFFGTIATT
jgi:hypothetical protein